MPTFPELCSSFLLTLLPPSQVLIHCIIQCVAHISEPSEAPLLQLLRGLENVRKMSRLLSYFPPLIYAVNNTVQCKVQEHNATFGPIAVGNVICESTPFL